jgi:hypothetical protein
MFGPLVDGLFNFAKKEPVNPFNHSGREIVGSGQGLGGGKRDNVLGVDLKPRNRHAEANNSFQLFHARDG